MLSTFLTGRGLAVFLIVGLLSLSIPVPTAVGHSLACDTNQVTGEEILASNPGHNVGSITEYLYLVAIRDGPLDQLDEDDVNNIDAYVHDLGCHRTATSGFSKVAVSITDELKEDVSDAPPAEVQLRFYDHYRAHLEESGCAQSLSDVSVPVSTQYVVVVVCEGLPTQDNLDPFTVEFNMSFG